MEFTEAIRSIGHEGYLGAVFDHIRRENSLDIAFLGGSITQGCHATAQEKRFADLFTKGLSERFPRARIGMFNAGIGATTSQFGCARVREHILSRKPQLAVVDFSVNDSPQELFAETFESLIRVLLSDENIKAVIILNNTFFDGRKSAAEIHDEVAAHYGLPIVDCARVFIPLMEGGKFAPLELSTDYLHPTDIGHEMIAKMLLSLTEAAFERFGKGYDGRGKPCLPERVTGCGYEECEMLDRRRLKPALSGFEEDTSIGQPFHDPFKNGWLGCKKGDRLEFSFTGKKLLIQWRKTPRRPAPTAVAYIEGGDSVRVTLDAEFEEDWGDLSCITPIWESETVQRRTLVLEIVKSADDEAFMVMSFIVCR